MLYKDSQKRIDGLNNTANLFKALGYSETEKSIREFAKILQSDKVPSNFLESINLLLDTHQKEFASSLPIGKEYRNRCFEELRRIIINSIGIMGTEYPSALNAIYPIFERLGMSKKVSGLIADILVKRESMNKAVTFHLVCYAYLIFVEGIFDELSRILYFLVVMEKAKIPSLIDIEEIDVWKTKKKFEEIFGTSPVFLENWETKNHIRNAIAHARTKYDSQKDLARFIDVNKGIVTYDSGDIKFEDFLIEFQELEDSVNAFTYILLLLKVYDYILAPSEFI